MIFLSSKLKYFYVHNKTENVLCQEKTYKSLNTMIIVYVSTHFPAHIKEIKIFNVYIIYSIHILCILWVCNENWFLVKEKKNLRLTIILYTQSTWKIKPFWSNKGWLICNFLQPDSWRILYSCKINWKCGSTDDETDSTQWNAGKIVFVI